MLEQTSSLCDCESQLFSTYIQKDFSRYGYIYGIAGYKVVDQKNDTRKLQNPQNYWS